MFISRTTSGFNYSIDEAHVEIYLASSYRGEAKSKLSPPETVDTAIIFRPALVKYLSDSIKSSRYSKARAPHSKLRPPVILLGGRLELPVTDISPISLILPPALYSVTNNIGFYFDNSRRDVFLEVISSTTNQQFTIQAGAIIANEWDVLDDIINITQANTRYFLAPLPKHIYNQPDGSEKTFVDHAVSAVLQFRAWRIT